MKQFVFKLLSILLLTMATFQTALAASGNYVYNGTYVDGIYYSFNKASKTASVTCRKITRDSDYRTTYETDYSGNVVIPTSVSYESEEYIVTNIAYYAFYQCTDLISITIPSSVTTIETSAFSGCTGLSKVIVEDIAAWCGISFISGSNPLLYAHHLYDKNNNEITDLVIPMGVTTIGDYAFLSCIGLTSISIPSSVTAIGRDVFTGCIGLTSITIPSNVTAIGSSAFSGCIGLTNVTLPNSLTSIEGRLFSGCTGLTSVTIPNSVTSIESYAFQNCTSLTNITIPNSVTSIGSYAFGDCTSLIDITIPNSVTSIEKDVFVGTPLYDNQPNGLIYIGNVLFGYKGDMSEVTNLEVKDGTIIICNNAFYNCINLTSITIPSSVTTIGSAAFEWCSGLTSITIPGSVTAIGSSAFYECSGLTNINILNGVVSIGNHAFAGCKGLTSIAIPNSVTNIGDYAFYSCTNLATVIMSDNLTELGDEAFRGTPWINNQPEGIIYYGKVLYGYNGTMTEGTNIEVKEGTTAIYNSAFKGCNGLTSITIPNSVTTIGSEAFQDCFRLTSITIPSNVTKINNSTFYGCSGLKNITIPNGVTSIGNSAFYRCNLDNVVLPESVTSIGGDAFYGTHRLTLPNSMKSIDTDYMCCVDSVFIGDSVTNIDNHWRGNYGSISGVRYFITPGSRTHLTFWFRSFGIYNFNNSLYRKDDMTKIPNVETTSTSLTFPTLNEQAREEYPIASHSYTINENTLEGNKLKGLTPDTYYDVTYKIAFKDGSQFEKTVSEKTKPIEFVAQQPKVASPGNVVVSSTTNLDDEEENVGFEWRRTDWTDDFTSNSGTAYLYEGMMEGYIRNLNTEKLWKFRPYYESASGNRYYGEWMGIDPTNTSYFEPTVHTYAKVEVAEGQATIEGSALAGTDDITEQGFEYWTIDESNNAAKHAPQNMQTITATGQRMTATLTGLQDDTTYGYRAYVKTAKGTTYGEDRSFKTPATTGIAVVYKDGDANTINKTFNVYTLSGTMVRHQVTTLEGLPQGIYIVNRKKVVIK